MGLGARLQCLLTLLQGPGRILIDTRPDDFSQHPAIHETQHVGDRGVADLAAPVGDGLVQEGLGVAHGTLSLSGEVAQALIRDFDAFGFADFRQPIRDLARGEESQVIALAARQNRERDFFRVRRGENEKAVRRGLLESFEQGVERRGGKHVDLVDDEDPMLARRRCVTN